jgi:hypothetical protein
MNWRRWPDWLIPLLAACVVVSCTVFAVWWTASHPRVLILHDKPSIVIIIKH